MDVSRRLLSSVVASTFNSAGYQQGDVLSLKCFPDHQTSEPGNAVQASTAEVHMGVSIDSTQLTNVANGQMDVDEVTEASAIAENHDAVSINHHTSSDASSSSGDGRVKVIYSDVCMEAFRQTENYMARILGRAKGLAELQGRTEITALDTLLAIQQLGTPFEDTVAHLREFKRRRKQTSHPLPPVDRTPASLEDEAKTTDFLRGECLLYDESHRQLRPSHVPSYLPQFPEPHSYMRTPVFYPPTTSFLEWRRKQVTHNTGLQIALSNLAAASTQPTPGHIKIDNSKKCTLPLLTRPRKSASWLAPHTTALDRAPMQEDGVANVLENPYFQPEEVTQFPLSWVKSQSAASSAAHKATPLAPLGTLRLDTVPIPLNVNEITLTVPAKTQDPRRETTAATTDDNPHTPHTLLLSVAKATGSTTNTVDPVAKGTGPTVGSITVRMEPESSGDVEMTDVAASTPISITLTPGAAPANSSTPHLHDRR